MKNFPPNKTNKNKKIIFKTQILTPNKQQLLKKKINKNKFKIKKIFLMKIVMNRTNKSMENG